MAESKPREWAGALSKVLRVSQAKSRKEYVDVFVYVIYIHIHTQYCICTCMHDADK